MAIRPTKPIFAIRKRNILQQHLIGIDMNTTELIAKVAETAGPSTVDAKKAVEATLSALATAVTEEDKVALISFDTFSVTTPAAHQGVNPTTGAAITIPEKKAVAVTAGAEMAL